MDFSQSTCFPPFNICIVCAACRLFGLAIYTALISLLSASSDRSSNIRSAFCTVSLPAYKFRNIDFFPYSFIIQWIFSYNRFTHTISKINRLPATLAISSKLPGLIGSSRNIGLYFSNLELNCTASPGSSLWCSSLTDIIPPSSLLQTGNYILTK